MIISEHAMKNFEINDTDDEQTVLLKKYYLSRNKIDRQIETEQKLNEFDKKYNDIKKMKSKTSLEQLKLQVAIEKLLND